MKLRVASLFSGIGGIDLGFKLAGFEIVWANEIDKYAATTYRNNFNADYLVEGNIKAINPYSIPDFDVLVAGFPCQPFSLAGKQRGFNDSRGNLFFEIARIIDIKRPSVIFLENVANLMDHDKGRTFLVIYNTLAQFGYGVRYKILDSQEYGNVPQKRRRIYIVAFLDYDKCNKFKYPEPIDRTINLNDIIDRHNKSDDLLYYDNKSKYYDELVQVVTDHNAIYRIYDYGLLHKAFYICPTLMASMGGFADRVPIVIDDFGIRKITILECLKLQAFPSDYIIKDIPLKAAYKQIGNSVTVSVIKRIAQQIYELYNA